ncbi:hypothetical protein IX318_001995 [Porphyromonas levii]|nr:hypothetical protein [Porphyromonas levii]MBR8716111.1 hypothetical protein [Porphyromonas levii]MBR8728650.1 hypothetical protein [Porphyromonas levii]MBR8732383.1 hypothetical protein [Porphyromonas levii]MBR8736966.1 hypothetical protein [Porphyromonas levii]
MKREIKEIIRGVEPMSINFLSRIQGGRNEYMDCTCGSANSNSKSGEDCTCGSGNSNKGSELEVDCTCGSGNNNVSRVSMIQFG